MMGPNSGGLAQEIGSTTVNVEKIELRRVECHLTDSLWKRMLRLIFPDQRKQERLAMPPLVGYLGTARASKPYDLGDISLTGFCLITGERWIPGTEMPITLRRTNLPVQDDKDSFTVQATVVRSDGEEVGFSIVLSEEDSKAVHGNPLRVKWMSRAEMEQLLERLKGMPESELPDGRSQIPGRSAASTQPGAGAQLNAAFESGR
jgi:hypothetical protein